MPALSSLVSSGHNIYNIYIATVAGDKIFPSAEEPEISTSIMAAGTNIGDTLELRLGVVMVYSYMIGAIVHNIRAQDVIHRFYDCKSASSKFGEHLAWSR